MATQCTACNGIYEPIDAAGVKYFHICPPLSAPELAAKVVLGKVALPAGESADVAVARRLYERANKRDENLPSTAPAAAGTIKAAGDGTKAAAAPASGVVIVPK